MKKNLIYNLIYQVIVLAVPFVTTPYLSRTLDVDGIGIYSYVSSVAYYFFVFITLGLNNYGNRAIAKCEKNKEALGKTFCSIYSMQLLLGIIMIIVYIFYSFYFANSEYIVYFLLYIPYILSAVLDINWFFYGLTEFKFTTIRSTIIKLLSLVMIFIVVREKNDLYKYFVIMSSSFFLSNFILWPYLFKRIKIVIPKYKSVISHLKPNIILFIPILAISIYRVMDKIMITKMSSVIENGYYENADKIISIALTLFSAVATVMMPSVSKMVSNKENEKIKILLRDTMQLTMFLAVGMMFGLFAIGKSFAPLFFGTNYYESGVIITILSITIVISGWKAVLRSQYLIPFEKDKSYVVSLVAGAVINILCNSILIPLYAARGAAIGTIIAETVGFVIQTYIASKDIDIRKLFLDLIIFLPPGIIMYIVVSLILNVIRNTAGLFISVVLGSVIFLILCLLIFKTFFKERYNYLKNTIFLRK